MFIKDYHSKASCLFVIFLNINCVMIDLMIMVSGSGRSEVEEDSYQPIEEDDLKLGFFFLVILHLEIFLHSRVQIYKCATCIVVKPRSMDFMITTKRKKIGSDQTKKKKIGSEKNLKGEGSHK